MIPGIAASAVVVATADLQYVTNVVQNTTATTYTFSSIDTSGSGILLIGVHNENANTTTPTVTVNGSSASLVVGSRTTTPGYAAAIYKYEGAVSSTATIVVTFSSSSIRCGVSTWRLSGATSTTPVLTGSDYKAQSSSSMSVSLGTRSVGSVGLGIQTNHGAEVVTLSNAATNLLSSEYDVVPGTNGSRFLGIKFGPVVTGGSYTMADTFPNSSDDAFLVAAVWV